MQIIAILFNLYFGAFFAFVLAVSVAAWTYRKRSVAVGGNQSRFRIVIPAHDEERGIEATVASCLGANYPPDRFDVLVIADNCTDNTAGAARRAGANVIERHDQEKRSKGYALEFYFERLIESDDADRFDAVVVVDADTRIDQDLLSRFSRALAEGTDWAQGYYSVSNADSSQRTRLMTYAFSLINGVWLLGIDRLGLSSALRGNGMCFSLAGLRRFSWKAYGLAEDLEFSWLLRIAGERVRFLPDARVYGEMVSGGGDAAVSQRQRWEVGREVLRKTMTGPLLKSPHLGLLKKLFYLLDLYMPTLSRLTMYVLVCLIFNTVAVRFYGINQYLLVVNALQVITLGIYCVSAFFVMGLPWRYAAELMHAPAYALWKMSLVLRKKPSQWVRTAREGGQASKG
jgi:cellulose synthase/poly-beta-1,6-N-acetylglucosamine synthase-like glycosyltransferase